MISAVFDATTLLQAATNRKGPAGVCLSFVDDGRVKLFVSAVTLDEIHDVLSRPRMRKAFPKLTDEGVQDFVEHLMDKGEMVENVQHAYTFERDPDDEPYLDLAIATHAAFIVTRDSDLLDLMQDEGFRKSYPALAIMNPVAFLQHVRSEATTSGAG